MSKDTTLTEPMLWDEIMKALNQQTVLIEQDNIRMEYYSGSED